MECRLIIGSTNVVELSGLRDRVAKTYPTTATVVLGLVDAIGSAVTNATAITLAYVSPTTGAGTTYRGTIPYTVTLTPQTYVGTVTVDYAGNRRVFTISCPAVKN